jgi:5-methylcytosine-specific restriction protein A
MPDNQQQNPDWEREELILACDLVAQNQWRQIPDTNDRVIDLSELLRRLPLHPDDSRTTSFRSPAGVARKLSNLATHHPEYSGRPTRGSRLDREVIADFLADPVAMHRTAEALREADAGGDFAALSTPVEDEDYGDEEGRLRLFVRRHVRRERSARLRQRKIDSVVRAGRPIACEICNFDFEADYGPRGKGYIDCHHIVPLHVGGIRVSRLADLALVCANCHRMIHVRSPWLTPDELRQMRSEASFIRS